jgi:hypothetical protein
MPMIKSTMTLLGAIPRPREDGTIIIIITAKAPTPMMMKLRAISADVDGDAIAIRLRIDRMCLLSTDAVIKIYQGLHLLNQVTRSKNYRRASINTADL